MDAEKFLKKEVDGDSCHTLQASNKGKATLKGVFRLNYIDID
jgi:hypothetical protein